MNCDQLRTELSQRDLGGQPPAQRHRHHLEDCELCRYWREERLLARALSDPVPEPDDGFEDRVLERAAAAAHHRAASVPWRRYGAAAAAALLALSALLSPMTGDFGERRGETATAAADATRTVKVVIDAKQDRRQALLTIELAEDLELEGFAGQSLIEWHTDLAKGRNLLTLPVRMKTGIGGDMRIALSYEGGRRTEMNIPVDA